MRYLFHKGVWASRKTRQRILDTRREDIKSIAVIRHAALGDMVLTRAFLIEARRAFPNAKITLSAISNYTLGIPDDLVDRVHIVHGHDQRDTPLRTRIRAFKQLGYHDLIFDLASSNRSYMILLFNKARFKIGFPYRKTQAALFYDIALCRTDMNFEVDDMMNMISLFGTKTAYPHQFDMPGSALKSNRPYIVYFTSASVEYKCWDPEKFSSLISEMSDLYPQYDHVILKGIQQWEIDITDSILASQNSNNVTAISTETIEDATSLIKGSTMLVSNDTGIRHLAIVSNIPTVGIMISVQPFRYWPRYDIHDVVLLTDEGHPTTEQALTVCCKLMDRVARNGNNKDSHG
jgi:ADP-heptose:LPS heptosyltransferase